MSKSASRSRASQIKRLRLKLAETRNRPYVFEMWPTWESNILRLRREKPQASQSAPHLCVHFPAIAQNIFNTPDLRNAGGVKSLRELGEPKAVLLDTKATLFAA